MSDTMAALLTGLGRGAVATVAIRGPNALSLVMSLFQPATKSIDTLALDRVYFGTWEWKSYREELVVCRVAEEQLEIHCHGGRLAARTILNSLSEFATVVSTSEWYSQIEPNRFVREAYDLLAIVRTTKAAEIALDQSRNAVLRALAGVRDHLKNQHVQAAIAKLQQIVSYGDLGTRLRRPFSVVLIGAPNTGKSSLVNAIVGFDRSIVYHQPGTTRDIVSALTALDGWPIALTDTAGIRPTDDPIELAGISMAEEQLSHADLVLAVRDLSMAGSLTALPASTPHPQGGKRIVVGTKSDLAREPLPTVDVITSAVEKTGINSLCQRIMHELIPKLPNSGEAVPITQWQLTTLQSLLVLLTQNSKADAEQLLAELLD